MNDDLYIVFVEKDDAGTYIFDEVSLYDVLSAVILFGGDRWHSVTDVVVAFLGKQPVGFATLARYGETGKKNHPDIVGVWVNPKHRNERIAGHMVELLSAYAGEYYGSLPYMVGVTDEGAALVSSCKRKGLIL